MHVLPCLAKIIIYVCVRARVRVRARLVPDSPFPPLPKCWGGRHAVSRPTSVTIFAVTLMHILMLSLSVVS